MKKVENKETMMQLQHPFESMFAEDMHRDKYMARLLRELSGKEPAIKKD